MMWSMIFFFLSGTWTGDKFREIILKPDSYFWFLWCLFWIQVVFYSVRYIAERVRLNENIGLCLIGLFMIVSMSLFEIRVCGYQFIAYYFLFFVLGYWLHKYDIRLPRVLTVLCAVCWIFLAWGWSMHGVPSWLSSVPCPSLVQYAYRCLTALLAVVVLHQIMPSVMNIPHPINRVFGAFGQLSLGVYTCHLTIISYVLGGLVLLPIPYVCILLLGTLLLSGVSWGIVWLLCHNRMTSRFLLGKL